MILCCLHPSLLTVTAILVSPFVIDTCMPSYSCQIQWTFALFHDKSIHLCGLHCGSFVSIWLSVVDAGVFHDSEIEWLFAFRVTMLKQLKPWTVKVMATWLSKRPCNVPRTRTYAPAFGPSMWNWSKVRICNMHIGVCSKLMCGT